MDEGFSRITTHELEDSEGGDFHPIDLMRLHIQLTLMRCFKLCQLLTSVTWAFFWHIRLISVNISSLHKLMIVIMALLLFPNIFLISKRQKYC